MYLSISLLSGLTTDRCIFAAVVMKKKINRIPVSLLCCLVISLLGSSLLHAQTSASEGWLIQLSAQTRAGDLVDQLEHAIYTTPDQWLAVSDSSRPAIRIRRVSRSMNTYLLQVQGVEGNIYEWLKTRPEIRACQKNRPLELRNTVPNDPFFLQQWQYLNLGANGGALGADMKATEAWDISRGGVTPAGDTIVVAVIDAGVNKSHPDLQANLWKNRHEIPGDGIDNDQNGYKDDYEGWNVFSENDQIQGVMANHGTPVSGIVGAVGDNGIGVSGVNWNVKIMFIAGGNTEAEILAAYDYVLQARKLYNETHGAKGAFVVAVNCSWGINYGSPGDAPLWCQAFDSLGQTGILSVAATTNIGVNVDLVGDLPTTCPSDYLISVTSLNHQDIKPQAAGWGSTHIDLGAYGENVYTLTGTGYGNQSGTSFAAPHVAGAIALLYAAPCPELIALAKSNPSAAATWARNLILNNTEVNLSLTGKTATNGKLNLQQLLQAYQNQCAACPAPFALQSTVVSQTSAAIFWLNPPNSGQTQLRYRKTGAAWVVVQNVYPGFILTNLLPCERYEFELSNTCEAGLSSEWSATAYFFTSGCCTIPNVTMVVTPGFDQSHVTWNKSHDFIQYKLKIRPAGATNWQTYQTADTAIVITGLSPCVIYEVQLQGFCVDGWFNISSITPFETNGCGACLDIPYCSAAAQEAMEEWISSVQLGSWVHQTGTGGGGYQDLTTAAVPVMSIYPQSQLNATIVPGYWGASYKEFYRIFIDFNLDGDFFDAGELVFDPGFAHEGIASGFVTTPAFTNSGRTRMRVMMKFGENNETPPEPCETFGFGQVEDYCINLETAITPARINTDSSGHIRVYPQPARDWVWVEFPGIATEETGAIMLQIFDIAGKLMYQDSPDFLRSRAVWLDTQGWPSGIYVLVGKIDGALFYAKLIKS